jgi:tetratricopeptide (TPR) repeat protein
VTLGQRIKAARRARGMTQVELGGSGLSPSYISMIEHDQVRPSLATLRVLADRLHEPLSAFLDSPPAPAEEARALLARGESLLRQHRFPEALETFEAASSAIDGTGDERLRARRALGAGQALAGLRLFGDAEPLLATARAVAADLGDPELTGSCANALGFLAYRRRRFAEAREIFQDGLDRLRSAGLSDSDVAGKLLSNLGRVYIELGLPAQAMECYRAAAGALSAASDPAHRALLLFNMGVAAERQGSAAQAQAYLRQAEELLRLQENQRLLGLVKRSLGILRLEQGMLDEAGADLDESLQLARSTHDDEGTAQTLVELARLRARRGEVEQARRDAREAADLAQRINDEAELARATAADAEALGTAGYLQAAVRRYGEAIRAFERLGMVGDLIRASRDAGFILLRAKRHEAAARQFARAFDLQSRAASAP